MATKDTEKEDTETSSEGDVLETALKRFSLVEEADGPRRRKAIEDDEFLIGEQWPDGIKAQRELEGRPCLTVNRLPQHVKQVTNDQRQNRPAIKVSPVDDKADVETAKIFQGIIRHIEYNSNADVAYDRAFEPAVKNGGPGFYRFVTDFCDPMSFDQDIFIKSIRNPLSVYFDPSSTEPDGSDANWAFVVEDMSIEDFRAQFPKAKLSRADDWESFGSKIPEWVTKDGVRVAEYFYKTFRRTKIHLLDDRTVVTQEDLERLFEAGRIEPHSIVASRETVLPAIKWAKINGLEVLEERDWPGIWIPIVPVYGDEHDINGKITREGIVRHAKDPQRMYNFWVSAETEAIALAPKAPWVGYAGQFEGFEDKWQTANVKNHAYLEVNPEVAGVSGPLPLPQRSFGEPAVQAITNARLQSSEDIKSTTGIYDAALGNRSNETSGVAIQRRNQQAQTSNFHFIDNLTRSIRHGGRILVDLIPKIYDAPRAARIIGEDGEEKIVHINQALEGGKQYFLGVGKYDVAVETGPSFATKRQEAVESIIAFVQAVPQAGAVVGDLLAKNLDWPGAQELAERLRKIVPPGIAEDPDGEGQQIPPQVQAQLQQMQMMIEQLTGALNESNEKIERKLFEIQSKERIELQKIEADILKSVMKTDSQDSQAGLRESAKFALQQQVNEINRLQAELEQLRAQTTQGQSPQGQIIPQQQNQLPGAGQPMGGFAPDEFINPDESGAFTPEGEVGAFGPEEF